MSIGYYLGYRRLSLPAETCCVAWATARALPSSPAPAECQLQDNITFNQPNRLPTCDWRSDKHGCQHSLLYYLSYFKTIGLFSIQPNFRDTDLFFIVRGRFKANMNEGDCRMDVDLLLSKVGYSSEIQAVKKMQCT